MGIPAEPLWLWNLISEDFRPCKCRCLQSAACWRGFSLWQGGRWWGHGLCSQHHEFAGEASWSSNPTSFASESAKDPEISNAMRYACKGWPDGKDGMSLELDRFHILEDTLSICHGCLELWCWKPSILRSWKFFTLDNSACSTWSKQLARTADYWPNTYDETEWSALPLLFELCWTSEQTCKTCHPSMYDALEALEQGAHWPCH